MKCSKCFFKNPEGMNFCGKCGTPLPRRCPKCGKENAPDLEVCVGCHRPFSREEEAGPAYARRSPRDYTPPFLVQKVLKTRNNLEGERKLVTVLFADVVDFTSIAERLDPEDVHEIMDGCFELLGEEIHGAGGTINQYTGDGVMALFGAPIAHEDHVRRACHAALMVQRRMKEYGKELARRYGISFRMRIGVHAGPVVVGTIGDNLRLDYTALGDTTNLAARLQTLAPPGKILVSERVWEGARRNFLFLEAGLFQVKGKEMDVRAFILDRRLEADLSEGEEESPVPFVGRGRELAELKRLLGKVRQGGGPLLVSVTGEAGIGKSRLLRSFGESLRDGSILFLEGRCRPLGQTIAFHPLIGMFRTYFDLSERDGYAKAREKIRRQLEDRSLHPLLLEILRLFEEAMGGKESSEAIDKGKKRVLFQSLRDLVLSISSHRPLVIGIDDMQWADATTREFLLFLLRSSGLSGLLLICLSRMEPGPWCTGAPVETLPLHPLDREDAARIFSDTLGTDRLDPRVTDEILSKAGGNPLFLLEMGETLKRFELVVCDDEKCTLRLPVKEVEVPDSIQGVLAARLDGLGEEQKRVVQFASVVGREFSFDLLTAAAPGEDISGTLDTLQREGIVDRISTAEGGRYQFRHQLFREVAYQSLLKRDRKRYHLLAGETMERLLGENLGDRTGFLAHHFHKGEAWQKALDYMLEAGRRAGRSYACSEAMSYFDLALDILARPGLEANREKLPHAYLWKGRMNFCLGRMKEARAAFGDMLSHSKRLKDTRMEGEALFRIGWILFYLHRPRSSEAFLTRAMAVARREGLKDLLPKANGFLGFIYAVLGRLKEAKPLLDEALRLSEEQRGVEGKAWSIAHLIQYFNWTGQFEKALALSDELRRINEEIKSPYFNIILSFRRGLIYGALGRLEEAEKSLEEGLKTLDVGDDRFWRPRFLNTLGWVYAEAGRTEDALRLNKEALQEARLTGDPETIRNALINVGENLLQVGRLEEAKETLERTWEEVKKRGIFYSRWRYRTRLLLDLGELYVRLGDRRRGLRFLSRGLDLARKSGSRKHEARALLLRGKIFASSNPPLAQRALRQALTLSQGMGTRLFTERIQRSLADTAPSDPDSGEQTSSMGVPLPAGGRRQG